MKKFAVMLAICAGVAGLLSVLTMKIASSQTVQDKFQYNAVYECAADRARNFKVLSCDKSGVCKVFIFNEYNPNGGVESEMSRALITETVSRYKCAAQGGVKNADAQEKDEEQTPKKEETPTKNESEAVACPASDPDSNGKTALEKSFRGAIRESWEREAEKGLDGAVTITFQAFNVGAARRYRVYEDPTNAAGKTIYPARATFTTCTDYNRRIETVKREREFSCYKNTSGNYSCTIIAAANTNVKDKTESIDKPR